MKNLDAIPAASIAGYCSESAVWSFLDRMTADMPAYLPQPDHLFLDSDGEFRFRSDKTREQSLPDGIRALGASAYYLIMGIPVLDRQVQTASSPIPSIPPRRASRELDALIRSCLAFEPEKRPSLQEIRDVIGREKGKDRRALKGNLQEDSYTASFWKEEMV